MCACIQNNTNYCIMEYSCILLNIDGVGMDILAMSKTYTYYITLQIRQVASYTQVQKGC